MPCSDCSYDTLNSWKYVKSKICREISLCTSSTDYFLTYFSVRKQRFCGGLVFRLNTTPRHFRKHRQSLTPPVFPRNDFRAPKLSMRAVMRFYYVCGLEQMGWCVTGMFFSNFSLQNIK